MNILHSYAEHLAVDDFPRTTQDRTDLLFSEHINYVLRRFALCECRSKASVFNSQFCLPRTEMLMIADATQEAGRGEGEGVRRRRGRDRKECSREVVFTLGSGSRKEKLHHHEARR